jgi:hypothetical protein
LLKKRKLSGKGQFPFFDLNETGFILNQPLCVVRAGRLTMPVFYNYGNELMLFTPLPQASSLVARLQCKRHVSTFAISFFG